MSKRIIPWAIKWTKSPGIVLFGPVILFTVVLLIPFFWILGTTHDEIMMIPFGVIQKLVVVKPVNYWAAIYLGVVVTGLWIITIINFGGYNPSTALFD